MERVTGIGGVFFAACDADALQRWYSQHLGVGAPRRFASLHDPEGNPVQLWEPAGP
jgi:hypothetical protein